MIIGDISDFKPADFSSPNIQKALRYIESHDLLAMPIGKVEIDGTNVYLNRQSYVGKAETDAKIEGHDHYLDLQLVLKGEEGFGYVNKKRSGIKATTPYDPVKDRTNYEGPLDGRVTLHPGQFALVYPNDLHQACVKVNAETIEKAVFKIKIDW
jgi:biofilm protein TabA